MHPNGVGREYIAESVRAVKYDNFAEPELWRLYGIDVSPKSLIMHWPFFACVLRPKPVRKEWDKSIFDNVDMQIGTMMHLALSYCVIHHAVRSCYSKWSLCRFGQTFFLLRDGCLSKKARDVFILVYPPRFHCFFVHWEVRTQFNQPPNPLGRDGRGHENAEALGNLEPSWRALRPCQTRQSSSRALLRITCTGLAASTELPE